MDRTRIVVAMILSLAVLMAWPVVMRRFFPAPPQPSVEELADQGTPPPPQAAAPAEKPRAAQPAAQGPKAPTQAATQPPATQVAQREPITIKTDYWTAKLSNRGAVVTSWILKSYPENGEPRQILPANGDGDLELIPSQIPESLAPPFSLRLPWSPELTRQLQEANFEVQGLGPNENEIYIGPGAQRRSRLSIPRRASLGEKHSSSQVEHLFSMCEPRSHQTAVSNPSRS